MDVTRYEIDNGKVICRLLPFFLRGRKTSLMLEAMAHPLKSLHKAYLDWALERKIEASTTSQKASLIWYLNHKMRGHFLNKEDTFRIITNMYYPESVIYNMGEQHEGDDRVVVDMTEAQSENQLYLHNIKEDIEENSQMIIIMAPRIFETQQYNNTIYEKEIKKCADKYLVAVTNYMIILT